MSWLQAFYFSNYWWRKERPKLNITFFSTHQQAVVVHVSNGTEASARRNEVVVWLHAGQLADAADGQRQRRRRLWDGRLPVLEIVKRKLQGSDAVAEIPADALLHVVVVVVVVVIDVWLEFRNHHSWFESVSCRQRIDAISKCCCFQLEGPLQYYKRNMNVYHE